MTEDIEAEVVETPSADDVKPVKSYTAEEMSKAIAREKASVKAKEEAKYKALSTELESYKEESELELKEYRDIMQSQINELMKEAPDSVKELLGELSLIKQWKWLQDSKNAVMLKKAAPLRPATQGTLAPEERFKDIRYKH